MASSAGASKRFTPSKSVQGRQDSATKTSTTSAGQVPRSFEYSAEFLSKSAATAYHSNPAYLAIERETLTAVAPFLELAKKRGKAEVTTKVVQAPNSSGVADPPDTLVDPADEPCIIPPRAPKHQLSNSSITLDDLRIGSRIMPALSESRSCPQSQDHSVNTSPDTTPRSIFSTTTNQSTPESTSSISRDSPSSILASRSRAMSGVGDSPKYSSPSTSTVNHASPSSSSINYAYGLGTASPQQLELMQNRLRSLSITSESPRKIPTTSLVPVIAPDPSFLLTKFIHDSVRLYSPSKQEHEEKQRLQTDLEAILQIIQPTASLVVFGSVKNGLALANADLDLMVVDKSSVEDQLHDLHVDLPGLYAEALRSQGYAVKLLTKTRIPLIKILREYVAGVFSVDISFDNPLALHNTRLMATYNACDTRFGVLVMFIKLWARARRINDSFTGTLKSYGFMIMLIYYLQNKATPALLPNLQMISTSRAISTDELECQGFDIWYAKDVSRMHAIQQNSQSVGELVEGFFSHFAYEFDYRDWVISINVFGGLQTKESKRWTQLVEHMNENGSARVKDRFILCVSDPFEISHNVARTVTRAGLYEIRGSMMAAVRAIRGNKLTDLLTPSL